MKRLIAPRKLKRTCIECDKTFKKGDVYYKKRLVKAFKYGLDDSDSPHIIVYEHLMCPKCKYKEDQHDIRYKEFQKVCPHPEKFIETIWGYMPGECVKEPQYDRCKLCGEILY